MNTLKLLLTADIGDLCTAAYQARDWAQFISMHEGSHVSTWNAFLALAYVCPWRRDYQARYPQSAPWRVVRNAM